MAQSPAVNRIVWAIVLLVLAVLAFVTWRDLEVRYAAVGSLDVRDQEGEGLVYLMWRGEIEAPMESRLSEVFDRYRKSRRGFVLSLSSPGGSLDHGARVVSLLQRLRTTHRLETVVEQGAECASMCVPVYLQGQMRRAFKDARFLFHEVSFLEVITNQDTGAPQSAKSSETDRMIDKYFKPAGVSEAWLAKMRPKMAGGRNVWVTARDLVDDRSGVVQDIY